MIKESPCSPYLEISPQYHSASCRDMLLFIPLFVTVLGFGGFGGSAVNGEREKKEIAF